MSILAVVVLSGGLDSATALGVAAERHEAKNVHTISFNYGQKHTIELECAHNLADWYEVDRFNEIPLNPTLFKGGVLTTSEEIPDMRYEDLQSGTMSPTYVPFRNGTMLSMATAYADSILQTEQSREGAIIYAGMHAEDGAGFAYADCTPEFLGNMASAIYIGTYGRVRLNTLFEHMEKYQIVTTGLKLGVPYDMTHSCYRGTRPACGRCATCHSRLAAFELAEAKDPIQYEETA